MSNLVITVVAIGVMVLACGMAAYYIGTTYQSSLSTAGSVSVMNEADQLSGMWKNFLVGNLMTPPADWSELIDAGYMDHVLEYSPGVGTEAEDHYFQIWPDDSGQHYYAVADLGDPSLENGNISCDRILSLASGTKLPDSNIPAAIPDFSAATLNNFTRYTCGPLENLPIGKAVSNITQAVTFPPQLHNILIYRLS